MDDETDLPDLADLDLDDSDEEFWKMDEVLQIIIIIFFFFIRSFFYCSDTRSNQPPFLFLSLPF